MASHAVLLFQTLFHAIAVAHHAYTFYSLSHLDFSSSKSTYLANVRKFNFRFFTIWNFTLETYYFSLCLLLDFLLLTSSLSKFEEKIQKIKHYVFRTFVFPLSFAVAIGFWGMFLVNRRFVFPADVDKVMPSWMNHAMHTNIVLIVLLEIVTSYHRYPRTRNSAMIGLTIYLGIYVTCYLTTYFVEGVWLYPIFDAMNWTQRILFLSGIYALAVGSYFFGEGLNSKIWENEIQNYRRKVKVK